MNDFAEYIVINLLPVVSPAPDDNNCDDEDDEEEEQRHAHRQHDRRLPRMRRTVDACKHKNYVGVTEHEQIKHAVQERHLRGV